MNTYSDVIDANGRVVKMEVTLVASKFTGEVNITDVMLQSGDTPSTWYSHPSEMKWTVDN